VLAVIDYKLLELLDQEPEEIMSMMPQATPVPQYQLDTMTDQLNQFEPHTMTDPVSGDTVEVTSLEQHDRLSAAGWTHN